MSVIPMRRRTTPVVIIARGNKVIPDGVMFLAGAALTLLAPTVVFCAVLGQFWPLYVMCCNEALGAALGLAMFKNSPADFLSCIPATLIPPAPSGANSGRLKKAA